VGWDGEEEEEGYSRSATAWLELRSGGNGSEGALGVVEVVDGGMVELSSVHQP
jgi:hypothetical protein